MKINLKWDKGELNLNLNEFFPATKKKVSELNDILRMADNEKQKRKEIIDYILKELSNFENNKIYIKGWNVKFNNKSLKSLNENTMDHKKKYKIQKLSEDYKKWNLYLQNGIELGLIDNRGLIDWEKVLED